MTNTTKKSEPLNYISSTRAVLQIHEIPKVSFTCTDFSIPGLSLSPAKLPTPFTDMPIRGDKLEFEPLRVQFLVTEKLENWLEIYKWLVGLSAPTKFSEFCEKPFETSNATVHLFTSKNNIFAEVEFVDLVPTSLDSLTFNSQASENDEISCSVSFEYQSYSIRFTDDLRQEKDFSV